MFNTQRSILKKRKEQALLEVRTDIKFIEEFKQEHLYFKEDEARKRFSELKRKEEKTTAEQDEQDILEKEIIESRTIQSEYRKLMELADDISNYLTLI